MSNELHLTDEQFADILSGDQPSTASAHLAVCEKCSAEAANLRSALGDFGQQSKIWAERHAATRTPRSATINQTPMWLRRVPAWSAAALGLVLTASAGLGIHRDHVTRTAESTQNQSAATVSQATLKADNDLLSDIDGELRVSDSTTTGTYSASGADRSPSTAKRTVTE